MNICSVIKPIVTVEPTWTKKWNEEYKSENLVGGYEENSQR